MKLLSWNFTIMVAAAVDRQDPRHGVVVEAAGLPRGNGSTDRVGQAEIQQRHAAVVGIAQGFAVVGDDPLAAVDLRRAVVADNIDNQPDSPVMERVHQLPQGA
jgi:hypothetical protein